MRYSDYRNPNKQMALSAEWPRLGQPGVNIVIVVGGNKTGKNVDSKGESVSFCEFLIFVSILLLNTDKIFCS